MPPIPESNKPIGLLFTVVKLLKYKCKKNPAIAGLIYNEIWDYYLIPNFVFTAGNKSVPFATINDEASKT